MGVGPRRGVEGRTLRRVLAYEWEPLSGQNVVTLNKCIIFAELKGKAMTKEQLIKESQMLIDEYADGNEDVEQMLEDALNLLNRFIELA